MIAARFIRIGLTMFTGALVAGCSADVPRVENAPFAGDASFTLPGTSRTGGLACIDVNNDGRLDVLTLSASDARLRVLINAADGYRAAPELDAGPGANLEPGDFNEDGNVDIAVSHHDTNEVWLFVGRGDGSFEAARRVAVPVKKPHLHMLRGADVNRDKHLDLLLAQSDDNGVWILLGDGAGGFAPSPGSPHATGNHPYVIETFDCNGDGHVDLATPNWYGKSVTVFLGDGAGNFKEAPGSPITGFAAPTALASGDLNGDGRIDLVVGNDDSRTVQILVGDGTGRFARGVLADAEAKEDCFVPILVDLSGDGRLDLIATGVNDARTFSYWINQGDGRFGAAQALPCPGVASRICVADLNGDAALDLVIGTWKDAHTYVWLGTKKR